VSTVCRIPGRFARSSEHLKDSRFLDSALRLDKHVAHIGLGNVGAIAAVEGIDMIAYGHSDLSARLGVHLQLEHPTLKAAVRRIAEACNAHGKLVHWCTGALRRTPPQVGGPMTAPGQPPV
jgi:2-keto-3-deoxy-L-rhamnonate aldolase RhmA